MRLYYIFLYFFFTILFFLKSDSVYGQGVEPECNRSDFNPNQTLVTFYGDSLGNLIDKDFYGYFGWETYLTAHNPSVNWKIQNLAVGGWTTRNVYDQISVCSRNEANRNVYKTADNVAFEIGGNDYKDNLLLLMWMPWKLGAVDQRVTYNTRVIVRMLRNPLRQKNVLVMGNFPAISKSPTLGDYTKYFKFFNILPTGQMLITDAAIKEEKLNEELSNVPGQIFNFSSELLITLANGMKQALEASIQILFQDGSIVSIPDFSSGSVANISQTGQDAWYWQWIHDTVKNPVSHVISIGLLAHQASLEAMVQEENAYNNVYTYTKEGETPVTITYTAGGVRFLPLYPYFIRHSDALLGHPYVANPNLYSDVVHINHLGYYLWSFHVEKKFTELGWTSLPEPSTYDGESCRHWNCGKTEKAPFGQPIQDPTPEEVVVHPEPIDYALLFCFLTGKCW